MHKIYYAYVCILKSRILSFMLEIKIVVNDIFLTGTDKGPLLCTTFAKCVSGNVRSIATLSRHNRRGDIAEHFSEDTLISVGGPVSRIRP